jgi:aspartokinase-like uncharacterized kinase
MFFVKAIVKLEESLHVNIADEAGHKIAVLAMTSQGSKRSDEI